MAQWSWKRLLWHAVRLALAAVALAVDLRLFMFYAFTIMLLISHQVDHLRATVRVFQVLNDARLLLLMRHASIGNDDLQAFTDKMLDSLPRDEWDKLEADFRAVTSEDWFRARSCL